MTQRYRWIAFSVVLVIALPPADAGWVVQHEGTPHRLLTDVHFSDLRHGWCVGHVVQGQSGAILKTVDGGAHWTQIEPGFVLGNGWGVHAVDSLNVWAAGGDCTDEQHGWIIRTRDGGLTWEQQIRYWTVSWTRFYGLWFADFQHGWATVGGYHGRVYRTDDGGETWAERWLPDVDWLTYMHGVHFEDQLTGWVVGGHEIGAYSHGVICRTDDGGHTWVRQGTEIQAALDSLCLYDVWFVDHQRGWAVGGGLGTVQGAVLHTGDGGTTWEVQSLAPNPSQVRLGSVCFLDPFEGWVAGPEYSDSGTAVYHTTDGGLHWLLEPGVDAWPLDVRFNGVHFENSANGWLVGDDMRILKYSADPAITVVQPSDGAEWWIGDSETIQWISNGVSGTVRLELMRDLGPWELLDPAVPDLGGGSWLWEVTGPPAGRCVMRITDAGGMPEGSSGEFSVAEPALTVVAPSQDDIWTVGEEAVIQWALVHTSGTVDIGISRDGGITWEPCAAGIADSGSHAWEVTGPAAENCLLVVSDIDGFPLGQSDPFTIVGTGVEGEETRGELVRLWCTGDGGRILEIRCMLSRPGPIVLAIYDLAGHQISEVFRGNLAAGEHAFRWHDSGVFVVRLEAAGTTLAKRFVSIR